MSTTNQRGKPASPVYDVGRLPPQALELEEAVIGAILLEREAFSNIADIIRVESFYKDNHQKIFSCAHQLFTQGKGIDSLTVSEFMRKEGTLDEVGGVAFLTGLMSRVASATHIEYHAKIIQQKFILRDLIRIGTEVQRECYEEQMDPKEIIDKYQSELFSLILNKRTNSRKLSEIGQERIKELYEIQKSDKEFSGVPTGFSRLDRMTSGWQAPDLIIIAARPSMGKTALALEFAVNAAKLDYPIDIYSLEMKDRQLYDRVLSRLTGIENSFFRTAQMDANQWEEIEKAQGRIEKYPIYIDDTPALHITEFRAKARRNARKLGTKLIIVDYLQLMKSPEAFRRGGREREVADISSQLKETAKELNIPVIALSQLNRDVDNRGGNKMPQLSDLRESGSIEQDADLVAFIHRPEAYRIFEDAKGNSLINIIYFVIEKHRNGSTGLVELKKNSNWTDIYQKEENLFSDISEVSDPDRTIEPSKEKELPF